VTLPPGPSSPGLLQTARFLAAEQGIVDAAHARYGDVFTLKILQLGKLVIVADPALIKEVFTGDATVLHAGEGNRILEPVAGPTSVLLLDEQPHLRQRKLLLPPMHGERMRVYGDLIAEITDRQIDAWPLNQPFQLHPSFYRITLQTIMRAVFGIEDGARLGRLGPALQKMLGIGFRVTIIPALRRDLGPWSPWRRFLDVRDQVDAILYDEIGRRREDPATAERTDVLSLMLQARDEDGNSMSDSEVRDELLTMLVAGHETTATALAWAFERLLRNPEVLAKLRASIAEGDDAYLDAVAKETLRNRPVLNFAMRRLAQPFALNGWELPAGVQIGCSIRLVHNRPDLYPDPQAFRPERFIDGGADTYSWIPFGGGVRRCLGAAFATYEMKVVLRRILERCELRADNPRPEARKRRAVTFVPAKGATAVLTARRPASEVAAVAAASA